MEWVILYNKCEKITSRACRSFNKIDPQLQAINKTKFVQLQIKFLNYGSPKAIRNLSKPVTPKKGFHKCVNLISPMFTSFITCAGDHLSLTLALFTESFLVKLCTLKNVLL